VTAFCIRGVETWCSRTYNIDSGGEVDSLLDYFDCIVHYKMNKQEEEC
jgi:hypothetical protein